MTEATMTPQRVRANPMSYVQAQMIVRNPNAYPADKRRKAAIQILSTMGASAEDVHAASYLA